MKAKPLTVLVRAGVVALVALSAGCGEYARSDRSPIVLLITRLAGGGGPEPDIFQGTLRSDVRRANGAVFDDMGQVQMTMVMKDPGTAAFPNNPSQLNQVQITRYRVTFRRSDGRNTPGVDVPHPFDSALSFGVSFGDASQVVFQLIRHSAKAEPPLAGLRGFGILSTIADVTFFGHDLAGNGISVTGSIGVEFGDFQDPED